MCGSYSSFSSKCETTSQFFHFWSVFGVCGGFLLFLFCFVFGRSEDRRGTINKHVAVCILLHVCMHETYAGVSICVQEWNYWAIGDAIMPNTFKNLSHQITFPHPKMLDCTFTSVGINRLLIFC